MPPAASPPMLQEAPDAGSEEEDPEEVEPWFPSDSDPEPDQHQPPAALEPAPKSEPEQHQQAPPLPRTGAEALPEERRGDNARPRWPGWPGASVFRLVVPADKVRRLIGRRGVTIKRLCDETRARVRVLDAAHGAAHQIVLVSATEEIGAEISPAMNAAIKIFKHINEIEGIDSDGTVSASALEVCSVRLLVPSVQAVHLIGKQGSRIKLIQETTGATIRIKDTDELLSCEIVDERIVDIRGASLKVHNALKSVLELLRKFLVDHGVLHLFERQHQAVTQAQDTYIENQVIDDYPLPMNEEFLLSDERSQNERDLSFSDSYSSDISHTTDSIITKVTQTMQIPLACAEEIIGVRGQNIEYIRSVSGAIVILEENRHCPSEVLVTIKGSASQVQKAQQPVQEVLSEYREPPPWSRYHGVEASPRLLNSPHGTRAGRDFLPPYREDELSRNHYGPSTRRGFRGYWL
ncbi:hypothetical protein EJB05_25392 [Eragrostis curvula]|uniref:K Homology domain-containing protein n=1 Tax=Eragrostis curvula TaxID=38414 RepID=A0A5J9VDT7_9POAL|nr:hypothetical protein EJB05_25392 [Eragrostis curvula]